MDRDRLLQLESAFDRLAAMPADMRPRALGELSSTDKELADHLARMLASDPSGLDELFGQLAREDAPAIGGVGPVIEGFSLLSVIGEGGFGVVYLAEQAGVLRRFVAIKVMRTVVQSPISRARFRDECRALALMDHPYVVGVLGSGVTSDGRPYLVMPLVSGLPIIDFCREHGLGATGMARIMNRVVRGLEYVHARGVIHRDIKPANILVSLVDEEPTPRLIDFGLAKAVEGQLSPHPTLTTDGQRVGTMQYMSPEQAVGQPVDVRSDIYSLGLIFYELLAGRPAISPERFQLAVGMDDVGALYAEPFAAPSRGVKERSPRELDWIVLHCLERDPARRYSTASAFAEDLERYLDGRAVTAGPPDRLYRVWSWVRRNRTTAAIVTAIVLAISAVTAVSLSMAGKERRARQEAEQVTNFAASILGGLNPMVAQGRDRTLLMEALAQAAAEARRGSLAPEVKARGLGLVAQAYLDIGEDVTAFPLAKEVYELTRQLYGERDKRSAVALVRMAAAARRVIPDERTEQELRIRIHALAPELSRYFPQGSRELIEAYLSMDPWINELWTDWDEFMRFQADVQHDAEVNFGPNDRLTIRVERWRARSFGIKDSRSLDLMLDARARAEKAFGPLDATTIEGLASETYFMQHFEGAQAVVEHLQRHLPEAEKTLGPLHKVVVMSVYNLGGGLIRVGRLEEAEPVVQTSIERTAATFGDGSIMHLYAWADRYLMYLRWKRLDEADAALAVMVSIARNRGASAPDFPELLLQGQEVGEFVQALDEAGRAERADELVPLFTKINPAMGEPLLRTRKSAPATQVR